MSAAAANLAPGDARNAAASGAARRGALVWSVAIALAAFVLRAAVALQYDAAHPEAHALLLDEAAYDSWARRIAAGDWLGSGVFFQEPLYAYALGAFYRVFGGELLAVRIVQAALGAFTCVVVERIGRRCAGVVAGRVAALWLAVHGPLLLFPSFVLKETALLLVLALATDVLLASRDAQRSWRCGAWIGALLGIGALLKGNVLVLAPFVIAWLAWPIVRGASDVRRRATSRTLAALGAFALALAPSTWRNHHVAGEWVPTTSQAGTNVYAGNNAQNRFGRASEVDFVRGVPEHEADDWRREAERRSGRALAASEVSSFWLRETWRSVAADPALHAAILWNKLRLSLGDDEVPDNHAWTWDRRYVSILRAPWPSFGLLAALGIAGALWIAVRGSRVLSLGIDPRVTGIVAGLGALYLATIVLTVTSDRARLPLSIWLAPLGATALVALARAWRTPREAAGPVNDAGGDARAVLARAVGPARIDLALLAAFATASAVVAFAPVLPASERAEDLDERDFNLAASLVDRGALDTARPLVAGLVQRHPDHARTLALAAELELEGIRARESEANPAVRTAAAQELGELARRLAEISARTNLGARERFRVERLRGAVELERGGWRAADDALESAFAFDPDDAGVVLGLARAKVELASLSPDASERGKLAQRSLELFERAQTIAREHVDARAAAWVLVRARAELLAGRHARSSVDPAERERGAAWIRAALERLKPLAADDRPVNERSAARLLAGMIQLAIGVEGSDPALASAENHFRAARSLATRAEAQPGSDTTADATLGLAQTLVTRAEREADSSERTARIREARALADELRALDATSAALRELDGRLDRLR